MISPLVGEMSRSDRGGCKRQTLSSQFFPANRSVAGSACPKCRVPNRHAPRLRSGETPLRPGLVQRPGVFRRAGHVVAAVHDDARDAMELVGVAQQLSLVQPAGIDEEMVFDARKGVGEFFVLERPMSPVPAASVMVSPSQMLQALAASRRVGRSGLVRRRW
jgi:hypothetical protein